MPPQGDEEVEMKVQALRNYAVAFSDAEGAWPDAIKAEMKRKGMAVVLSHLGFLQRFQFGLAFWREKQRIAALDLSGLRERGFNNDPFIAQQVQYLALFCALKSLFGSAKAIAICKQIMDETADALILLLPEPADVLSFADPFNALREYFRAGPEAARKAAAGTVVVAEDADEVFQFDITSCIWLDLASLAGVPEACIPNCYADDLVFPQYFAALGVDYTRQSTLALGASQCDCRFRRLAAAAG